MTTMMETRRRSYYYSHCWRRRSTSLVLPVFLLLATFAWDTVRAHGRLRDPISRSSMWREGYDTPHNYEDNQLFCGGVQVQYEVNGGKCGVCGDPYNGKRDNEVNGLYATGIVVRNYTASQVMVAVVELTANHKGWFLFNVCPKKNYQDAETPECFDKHPLKVAGTDSAYFPVKGDWGAKKIYVRLVLPKRLSCPYCVFRWKYNAGNSWGVDPVTKKGCIGCGNQEQFYGCADITIIPNKDDLSENDNGDSSASILRVVWFLFITATFTSLMNLFGISL